MNLFLKYKLNKEYSHLVHYVNNLYLRRIFSFSMIFGIIMLMFVEFYTKTDFLEKERLYYSLYIIIGVLGLVLCYITHLHYSSIFFCIISFYVMLTFFLTGSSITEFFFFFVAFSFVLVLLLNINPFIYTASIILYDIVLAVLIQTNVISIYGKLEGLEILNSLILNTLIIYLSFCKRDLVIKKYNLEKNIKHEKEKAEKLLLNILPQTIMEDLRDHGRSVPKKYENTTVLFCSISNFTELSHKLDIQPFMNMMNKISFAFDSIVEEEQCLRIKTSGNVYMAICGLPVPEEHHAEKMANCAIKFIKAIEEYNKTAEEEVRISVGLNSGKVVAGIVGIKRYVYDVFGDTVNTAFRMDSLCEEMKIRLTASTYNLVNDNFTFVPQPPVMVKGKGMLETYYLAG